MSKRRTKKQQRQLEDGIKSVLLVVAGISYYFTRQLYLTLMVVGVIVVLIIVFAVLKSNREKERLRNSGIEDIDKMDGILFEHYLKELYQSRGYAAEVTSASGDYGADLLLKKDGRKIVVQAKRYAKDVGIKAVQEVLGAKSYYKAEEAWVVSNSYFTKAARELAAKGQVMLVNRDELIDYILLLNPGSAKPIPLKMVDSDSNGFNQTCGKCGSPMVLKTGKRGAFLGCSSFPKCRNTRGLNT
ncbi:restriction endonuclease [Bacillus sp. OK048]|uniref:restriction endonuclease n=1 Tax=Bacillus sp. OK048 TaxID=1882761 RepID=UPI00088604BA|nr:restriction endonuclease [Bacillus sp. OK048]SDM87101.1 restriction system protein [Bacillus sp. OK048]